MQDRTNDMFVSKKFGIGIGKNFGLFAQCIDIQIVKKLFKNVFLKFQNNIDNII